MRTKILPTLAVVCALALAAPSSEATPLTVGGGPVVPEGLPDPGNVSLLGYRSGTFDFGSGPGHITGTWEQGVLVDPFGLTCAGCLDFFGAVTLDGGLQAGINVVEMFGFGGFSTNVGYVVDTGIVPLRARRPVPNGVFFFCFDDPTNTVCVIGPGGESAAFVVATDATQFDQHGGLFISGGREGSPASGQIDDLFRPVPEPVTLSLLGIGLAGIGFSRRKHQQ